MDRASPKSDTFGSRIVGAVVRRSDGSSVIVRAKVVVLAAGGVECAAPLLTDATKPGGPGNQHDNIGRYATDHIEFRMGTIVPSGPEMIDLLSLYDIRRVGRYLVSGMLTIAESVKRQEGLLNLSAVLVPQTAGFGLSAHRSIATLRAARNSGPSLAMLSDLGALLRAPRETAEALRLLGRTYHEYHGGRSRPASSEAAFAQSRSTLPLNSRPNVRTGLRSVRSKTTWGAGGHALSWDACATETT